METCDALIVGGGPAGSSCARELRRAGLEVSVLDKAGFPRDKICAGWVTPAVMESLAIDLDDYARRNTLQSFTGFRTSRIGDRQLHTGYRETVSYGIRRYEFDDYLLRRAGARLRLGEKLRALERKGKTWIVNGAIETPLVIGAGGHYCPVARYLGAKVGATEPAVLAQEIEFLPSEAQWRDCPVAADIPELFFTPDLKGYGWVLRKGEYLNIGLGRQDGGKLSAHVADFVSCLRAQGRIPNDLPKFNGHAYLLYPDATRRLFSDGMLLIGDAAGLAYPQSGEGIRTAVESGLMAAAVIAASEGDFSAASLRAYERALTARFGARGGAVTRSLLPRGLQQRLAGALMSMPWFVRHVLIERWFLHSQQAAMLPRMAE